MSEEEVVIGARYAKLHCPACGIECLLPVDGPSFCENCERRLPPSLLKALGDYPWDYALKLRSGEVFRFTGAYIEGEWVHLRFDGNFANLPPMTYSFDRGVDVRLSEIVWCADAPEGS